jgi:hypothetical protein
MKQVLRYSLYIFILFLAACADEGSDPGTSNTDDRDKFTGAWLCTEKLDQQPQTTFTIDISKGSADTIKIKNFSNYGDFTIAYGEVNGNSVVIPQQNMGVTSIPVFGTAVYSSSNGGKISMDYTVDGTHATATCVRP